MNAGTQLLDALPVATYTTDRDGFLTYFNEAAAELWGHRPEIGVAQWCGAWRLYWPNGKPMRHEDCPMATALRTGEEIRGIEAVAERPDGTRVPFMPYPTVLRDDQGNVTGAINVLVNLNDRTKSDIEIARLAAIVSSSEDAIISKTLEGIVTSWNAGATRIFGYEPEEMIGQPILRIIPPEHQQEEVEILSKLRRGERIEHFDTIRLTKDGRRVNISLTVSPVRDRHGNIVGASKVARDITERKRAEELQKLLFDELNHRVKNSLATVQAIATQSLRRSANPKDFVTSFSGRVQALARAHDLLVEARMRGSAISDIIREQVLFGASDPGRIHVSGPTVMLNAKSSVQVALVLHELSTNARKYGALKADGGHLSITWQVQSRPEPKFHLVWHESGVPNVTAPETRGFGTTLIERSLEAHGGTARIEYHAGGLVCTITLPLQASEDNNWLRRAEQETVVHEETDTMQLKGKRIFVVEDEPLVAMELETLLEEAGCHVVGPVGTVREAETLIESAPIDAAILDVNIEGRPVESIAAAALRKGIPFLFATGYGQEGIPKAFAGTKVIAKPFDTHRLLEDLAALLEKDQDAKVVKLRSQPR